MPRFALTKTVRSCGRASVEQRQRRAVGGRAADDVNKHSKKGRGNLLAGIHDNFVFVRFVQKVRWKKYRGCVKSPFQ